MFVVMGACGHVGSEVVKALLKEGQGVIGVTHDPGHVESLTGLGAQAALADVNDPAALRAVFRKGRRAFLLNPPAAVDGDTDQVERHTVACILEALRDSGLEKVVAESTGGARPGERLGDLNVLWELEEGLRHQSIPAAINRAGFYMSNWDSQLDGLRESGQLVSLFPAGLRLPMAAPRDLGDIAARRLLSSLDDVGVQDVEGPARYSADDVAAAFAAALQRDVRVTVTPRAQWVASFRALGFSQPAAESYARMTGASLDELDLSDAPVRGRITIDDYVRELAEGRQRTARR